MSYGSGTLQNCSDTGAFDPTVVLSWHSRNVGWLEGLQQHSSVERRHVPPRSFGPPKKCVDPVHPDIHTHNVENQWTRAK